VIILKNEKKRKKRKLTLLAASLKMCGMHSGIMVVISGILAGNKLTVSSLSWGLQTKKSDK